MTSVEAVFNRGLSHEISNQSIPMDKSIQEVNLVQTVSFQDKNAVKNRREQDKLSKIDTEGSHLLSASNKASK